MLKRQLLSILVLALTVSACGFHLRGSIPLPESLNNLFVQAATGSFKNTLESVLQKTGATISQTKASAKGVLEITEFNIKNEVGTLDERGKVDSYTLVLTVAYTLIKPDGQLARKAKLTERRQYDYNPAQVVESESEQRGLQQSMEQDIALRIVRQLSVMTQYPNLTADEATPE